LASRAYYNGTSGTDVMIKKKYFAEIFGENIGVFAQTNAIFGKHVIITLVCEKKTPFVPPEKWLKSQKNVIVHNNINPTSAPIHKRRRRFLL
jgi:hypothetical protein